MSNIPEQNIYCMCVHWDTKMPDPFIRSTYDADQKEKRWTKEDTTLYLHSPEEQETIETWKKSLPHLLLPKKK